jgi:hypothetical protein
LQGLMCPDVVSIFLNKIMFDEMVIKAKS